MCHQSAWAYLKKVNRTHHRHKCPKKLMSKRNKLISRSKTSKARVASKFQRPKTPHPPLPSRYRTSSSSSTHDRKALASRCTRSMRISLVKAVMDVNEARLTTPKSAPSAKIRIIARLLPTFWIQTRCSYKILLALAKDVMFTKGELNSLIFKERTHQASSLTNTHRLSISQSHQWDGHNRLDNPQVQWLFRRRIMLNDSNSK